MIKIDRLVDCCGCASCVQSCPKQCISFNEDKQGFRYPIINKSICIECGSCDRACPMLKQRESLVPMLVYAAKNKNEEIRYTSSSGGIFTLLAEKILSEGGVVFGARFDEQWEVVHDYTETIDGLAAFRGSKYMQSKIGDSFQKTKLFLHKGRKVLFSGTPCQIAGLKSYLQKDYANLICVDFVCHGVPSPKVWRKYLKEVARNCDNNAISQLFVSKSDIHIMSVNFRDKTTGWKKYSFTVSLSKTSVEGDRHTVSQSTIFSENAFMQAFLHNIILRPSCYECKFREGKSCSDITLGDYWGINKLIPEFDDDIGVSLVMIYTNKGLSIFPFQQVNYLCMTFDSAKQGNSNIYKSCKPHSMNNYFFLVYLFTSNVTNLINRCIRFEPCFFYRVLRKFQLVK